MIQGVVTSAREAVVRIHVLDDKGKPHEIEAILDTGFTDFLSLPPMLVATMGLPFKGNLRATLADETVAELSYHRATVLWDGQRRKIVAVACDGRAMIGMSLLYGYDVHIEARDGGAVKIERRSR